MIGCYLVWRFCLVCACASASYPMFSGEGRTKDTTHRRRIGPYVLQGRKAEQVNDLDQKKGCRGLTLVLRCVLTASNFFVFLQPCLVVPAGQLIEHQLLPRKPPFWHQSFYRRLRQETLVWRQCAIYGLFVVPAFYKGSKCIT